MKARLIGKVSKEDPKLDAAPADTIPLPPSDNDVAVLLVPGAVYRELASAAASKGTTIAGLVSQALTQFLQPPVAPALPKVSNSEAVKPKRLRFT